MYRDPMIETYVLSACVLVLGVAFLVHRQRVLVRFEALEDSLGDTRSTAEQADRASRRLFKSQNPDQDSAPTTG